MFDLKVISVSVGPQCLSRFNFSWHDSKLRVALWEQRELLWEKMCVSQHPNMWSVWLMILYMKENLGSILWKQSPTKACLFFLDMALIQTYFPGAVIVFMEKHKTFTLSRLPSRECYKGSYFAFVQQNGLTPSSSMPLSSLLSVSS